jgi:hypothetical protein
MPESLYYADIAEGVRKGFERTKNYRQARAMYLREYVGAHYRSNPDYAGSEPLNLIFNAIRATVPQIVMKNPLNSIGTDFLAHKEYAELLSLAVDRTEKNINLRDTLRAWIVDAFFGIGILKTGICVSDQCIMVGDVTIDPGAIYTEVVSIDNFTFDPDCTNLDRAWFMGDAIRLPRADLFQIPFINKQLVADLPKASEVSRDLTRAEKLSKRSEIQPAMQNLRDYVDVVQLYFPTAHQLVLMADPRQVLQADFLSRTDYFGPDEGMYTFLPLTQPVPDNPLPVAPIGVWYDLHKMANEMFVKVMDQAGRQKDIVFYQPGQSEEALDAWESPDGEFIKSANPQGFQTVSLGGQNKGNEVWLNQLTMWFNFMAGNPDQMSGASSNAETATQAEILQANAGISLEDVRGIVYDRTSQVSHKIGWYHHYNPLMKVPLIREREGRKEQVILTPEMRQGDYFEYYFKLLPKSMSRLDPIVRTKRIIEFATKIIPQAALAASAMLQFGLPFNLQRYLTKLAEELELGDWIVEMFDDPEFKSRLELMIMLGPKGQNNMSTGMGQSVQNGGFANAQQEVMTPEQERNQARQSGGGFAQGAMSTGVF